MQSNWQQLHEAHTYKKGVLHNLTEKAEREELTTEELVTLAYVTAQVVDFATAQPIFNQALEKAPNNAQLMYVYGQLLLEEENADSIKYLELAMELDRTLALNCCQLIHGFLKKAGMEDRTEHYANLTLHWKQESDAAQLERSSIGEQDTYLEHTLRSEEISKIANQLVDYPEVGKTYLVQKEVKFFPDIPLCILVVELKNGFFSNPVSNQKVIEKIAQVVKFPQKTFVVRRLDAPKSLQKFLKAAKWGLILQR